MPLTKKGQKIMANMRKQYGARAEEIFYRSLNKGTISGVHKAKKHFKGGSMHGMELRPRKKAIDCTALIKKCVGGRH